MRAPSASVSSAREGPMRIRQGLGVALLLGLMGLAEGCAELPDRLDNLADAGREFAVGHPVMSRAALVAARAALRKPQHLRVVCDTHCLIRQ
jgi:hypothetical protein